MPTTEPIKILFLGASPTNHDRMRLGAEVRRIKGELAGRRLAHRFELIYEPAVQISDVSSFLSKYKPHLVHISAHGAVAAGQAPKLVFEDADGRGRRVDPDALVKMFGLLRDNLRCVVVNSCFSAELARAITQHIDCSIGVSAALLDPVALTFSARFYRMLADRRSVQQAYEVAKTDLILEGLPQSEAFVLHARQGVKAAEVFFGPANEGADEPLAGQGADEPSVGQGSSESPAGQGAGEPLASEGAGAASGYRRHSMRVPLALGAAAMLAVTAFVYWLGAESDLGTSEDGAADGGAARVQVEDSGNQDGEDAREDKDAQVMPSAQPPDATAASLMAESAVADGRSAESGTATAAKPRKAKDKRRPRPKTTGANSARPDTSRAELTDRAAATAAQTVGASDAAVTTPSEWIVTDVETLASGGVVLHLRGPNASAGTMLRLTQPVGDRRLPRVPRCRVESGLGLSCMVENPRGLTFRANDGFALDSRGTTAD